MWVVVITSFIAIILAYLSGFKGKEHLFELGFILVTFIAVIHYDYGNDYMVYYDHWKQLRHDSWGDILSGEMSWSVEIGWAVLNRLFYFEGGFFVLVAILNILQNYIYYTLIKKFVLPKDRWLSMLLYLCISGLYLMNFSMLRQGLAVALFVASILFVTEHRPIRAILTILIAFSIHNTAIIGIPFLLLYFIPLKNTKTVSVVIAILAVILFFVSTAVSNVFNNIMTLELLEKYEGMGEGVVAEESLGMGFVLLHIPHAVILYCLWKNSYFNETKEIIIAIIAFFDIVVIPFTYIGSAYMSRLEIYNMAFQISVIPMLYSRLRNTWLRRAFTFIAVFIVLYSYKEFFSTWYWKDTFGGPFHTIFSQL